MSKYLDSNGLLYFWQKLKGVLGGKVDAVAGKGLSANDYTTAEKTKLAGIAAGANAYTHPAGDGSRHVPATGTGHNGKFLRAGATAASEAWGALAKGDVTGALGYTPPTPAQLEEKATAQSLTATLLADGWSGAGPYTQTVAVADMLATDEPLVDVVLSDVDATALAQLDAFACLDRIDTAEGQITAKCFEDKPEVGLMLALKVVR